MQGYITANELEQMGIEKNDIKRYYEIGLDKFKWGKQKKFYINKNAIYWSHKEYGDYKYSNDFRHVKLHFDKLFKYIKCDIKIINIEPHNGKKEYFLYKFDEFGNLIFRKEKYFDKDYSFENHESEIKGLKNTYEKWKYNKNNQLVFYKKNLNCWKQRKYFRNGQLKYVKTFSYRCGADITDVLKLKKDNYEWVIIKYDKYGNEIYSKNNHGYWEKRKYLSTGEMIFYRNSEGTIENSFEKKHQRNLNIWSYLRGNYANRTSN